MKLGQVWYTRALHGAGGINQFQVVAASGRLGDRSQPLAQEVLKSCYRPSHHGPTLSWESQRGASIATHRVAAAPDETGRPGNFFVHAVVGPPGALPARHLAGLWGADGWVEAMPAEVPPKLETLASIDELGLAAPAPMDREVAVAVVGGFLANVRQFRPTALALPPGEAVSYAALVSMLLPSKYGLVSFCSNPDDEQIDRYAIVAGRPASARFVVVDPAEPQDPEAAAMALVLLAAYDADPRATLVIEAIADRSQELVHLADGLRHWVRVDRAPGSGSRVAPADAIEFIKGDARLAQALAQGPGRDALAEAVAAGLPGTGQLLAAIEPTDAIGPLIELAARRVAATNVEDAVSHLVLLAPDAPGPIGLVARGAVDLWSTSVDLSALSGRGAAALLRVIGAASPRATKAPQHLITEASADLVAADPELPAGWRSAAVHRYPHAVRDTTIATALLEIPGLAADLADHMTPTLIDQLGAALRLLPPENALEAAQRFVPVVPGDDVDQWIGTALAQMQPAACITRIRELARTRGSLPSAWGSILADALGTAVLRWRPGTAEPPFHKLIPVFGSIELPTSEVLAWEPFSRAYSGLDSSLDLTRPARSAAAAAANLDPQVQPVLFELIYGRIISRAVDVDGWVQPVSAVWKTIEQAERAIAWRALARSTVALPAVAEEWSPRLLLTWWLAGELANGTIPKAALEDPLVRTLADQLTHTDRRHLDKMLDDPACRGIAKMLGKVKGANSARRLF